MNTIDDIFNKQQYEEHIDEYLEISKDGHIGGGTVQSRIAVIENFLPKGSHIFEIGSGGGDDALALQEAGYNVTASDYTDKFVRVLSAKGLNAILFDAKQDGIPKQVDAVYANAVFVHFTKEEFRNFLKKTGGNLMNSKIVYFSVLRGEGMERRGTSSAETELIRDFQYYTEEKIREILKDTGFQILDINLLENKWLQVVAQSK